MSLFGVDRAPSIRYSYQADLIFVPIVLTTSSIQPEKSSLLRSIRTQNRFALDMEGNEASSYQAYPGDSPITRQPQSYFSIKPQSQGPNLLDEGIDQHLRISRPLALPPRWMKPSFGFVSGPVKMVATDTLVSINTFVQ